MWILKKIFLTLEGDHENGTDSVYPMATIRSEQQDALNRMRL